MAEPPKPITIPLDNGALLQVRTAMNAQQKPYVRLQLVTAEDEGFNAGLDRSAAIKLAEALLDHGKEL